MPLTTRAALAALLVLAASPALSQTMFCTVPTFPGDVVVFYSDGLTEAPAPPDLPPYGDPAPGEPFETDRLADVIRAHHRGSAAEIHDAIKQAVEAYTGGRPADDDLTLVVLKVRSTSQTANLEAP